MFLAPVVHQDQRELRGQWGPKVRKDKFCPAKALVHHHRASEESRGSLDNLESRASRGKLVLQGQKVRIVFCYFLPGLQKNDGNRLKL